MYYLCRYEKFVCIHLFGIGVERELSLSTWESSMTEIVVRKVTQVIPLPVLSGECETRTPILLIDQFPVVLTRGIRA